MTHLTLSYHINHVTLALPKGCAKLRESGVGGLLRDDFVGGFGSRRWRAIPVVAPPLALSLSGGRRCRYLSSPIPNQEISEVRRSLQVKAGFEDAGNENHFEVMTE